MEEVPSGRHHLILSHAFWKRRFAGSPQVLGMNLTVEGILGTVVGVMPPGFFVLNAHDVDLWSSMNPESRIYSRRNDHWLFPIARLNATVPIFTN